MQWDLGKIEQCLYQIRAGEAKSNEIQDMNLAPILLLTSFNMSENRNNRNASVPVGHKIFSLPLPEILSSK